VLQTEGKSAEAGEYYRQARARYAEALDQTPTNPASLFGCALLCRATGDTNGCRATAEKAVARLHQLAPGPHAHLAYWACALAPDALTNYSRVLEAARYAFATQTKTTNSGLDRLTLGALLCRAHRYPEAVQQLTDAHQLAQRLDPNVTGTSPAYSACFLAMAHAHLGHTNEAREWFQRACQPDPFVDRGWNRRLALDLLRQEAQSVLEDTLGLQPDVIRRVVPGQP
jgi:tetratricopeptide (TPR) repeat protein